MTFDMIRDKYRQTDGGDWNLVSLSFALLLSLVIYACSGCTNYKGGKIVEGTDVAAGMSIPQSGGTLQIDALNFLTGFRFLFAENAGVKCIYCTTNTVTAFGMYSSTTVKRIEIELTPTIDEAEEESHATDRESETESDKPPPPDVGDTSQPK